MYRPKDWKKKYPHPCTNCDDNSKYIPWDCREGYCRDECTEDDEYATFEAGADAMLVALMEDGLEVDISKGVRVTEGSKPIQVLGHTVGTPSKGTIVFIPEEIE